MVFRQVHHDQEVRVQVRQDQEVRAGVVVVRVHEVKVAHLEEDFVLPPLLVKNRLHQARLVQVVQHLVTLRRADLQPSVQSL